MATRECFAIIRKKIIKKQSIFFYTCSLDFTAKTGDDKVVDAVAERRQGPVPVPGVHVEVVLFEVHPVEQLSLHCSVSIATPRRGAVVLKTYKSKLFTHY